MGWIKDSISWAHFVTMLRETVDALRKSLNQHSAEIQQLRQQNNLLVQQLVQNANEFQRLERKIESIEAYLRAPFSQPNHDGTGRQPRLPIKDPVLDDSQHGASTDPMRL